LQPENIYYSVFEVGNTLRCKGSSLVNNPLFFSRVPGSRLENRNKSTEKFPPHRFSSTSISGKKQDFSLIFKVSFYETVSCFTFLEKRLRYWWLQTHKNKKQNKTENKKYFKLADSHIAIRNCSPIKYKNV